MVQIINEDDISLRSIIFYIGVHRIGKLPSPEAAKFSRRLRLRS